MSRNAPLLAKSTATPDAPEAWCTLSGHTERSLDAAEAILDVAVNAALTSFGLAVDTWAERCRAAVRRGAFAHDLGKANDHFQTMVRGDRGARQGHRHELLSLWLLSETGPLHQWLLGDVDQIVADAVVSAVAGHHLKFENIGALQFSELAATTRLTFLGTHPDLVRVLNFGFGRLGLEPPPDITDTVFDAYDNDLERLCLPTLLAIRSRASTASRDERIFIAIARSMVVAADITASMLARRKDTDPVAWVRTALGTVAADSELRGIVKARLDGQALRPFQADVSASPTAVTLVRAGCGTGKTAAAYLWAAAHAQGRKLFVCYPTTGTATEGFGDYLGAADIARELVHSRARVDLELLSPGGLLTNGTRPPDEAARQWNDIATGMPLWGSAVGVATADVVLGLLQNYRVPLFAFPAIATGLFVFDEIHQYDDRLFAALCRFVEEASGAPILLMTASLSLERLRRVQEAVRARGDVLTVIDGPADLESGDRYAIQLCDATMAGERVQGALREGCKVLWVCNTVASAVAVAERVSGMDPRPLVYHSRFRYEDRAARHRDVVDAFRREGPAFAVTTQVCEVSLDLSADLLVSEVAAIPAMIQRLGRLNRRFDPVTPTAKPALFIEAESPRPYTPADLMAGRVWLSRVTGRPTSQRDLAAAFEELAEPVNPASPHVIATWLDAIPFAWPAPLREMDPSLQVLLPADAPACQRGGKVLLYQVVRRAIPMPLRAVAREFSSWPRVAMAFVAPEGRVRYSPLLGASWVRGGEKLP
jgi:CRISPR-associated endonuclease/helicase Cas3